METTITITQKADGTITVTGPDGQPQPAASVDEALNTAKGMLGAPPEAEGEAAGAPEMGAVIPGAGPTTGGAGMMEYLKRGK